MTNGGTDKGSEIILRSRAQLCIDGVEEVVSFEAEGVRLKSVDGELFIEGRELKILTLDTDNGRVEITGRVNGIYYASDPDRQKRGLFSRSAR
jgi:sporulation protein YabP